MAQKENPLSHALMDQILNGNSQSDQTEQAIQMPELALRCAQFFHSLSQYCLYFYKNYNREADIHKTKLIKKIDRSKKHKNDQSKKQNADEKKAKNQRGENEPQPPKKPLTAYILYFQDKKPSFAEKFPSLSLSQLTKLIAKDWKDLKQEQKKPYLDRAAQDRKRYEVQINEFKRKYRLGQGGKQEQEFIVEENKSLQGLDKKEQEIAIQIEEQIKAAEIKNVKESGMKSERQGDLNDQGVNDDQQDDNNNGDDDGEEQENSQDQQGDEYLGENQGSEDEKINEQ